MGNRGAMADINRAEEVQNIIVKQQPAPNSKPESPGRGLRSSPPACTVSLSEVQKPRDLDLDLGSG